jgi:hypothetical protein
VPEGPPQPPPPETRPDPFAPDPEGDKKFDEHWAGLLVGHAVDQASRHGRIAEGVQPVADVAAARRNEPAVRWFKGGVGQFIRVLRRGEPARRSQRGLAWLPGTCGRFWITTTTLEDGGRMAGRRGRRRLNCAPAGRSGQLMKPRWRASCCRHMLVVARARRPVRRMVSGGTGRRGYSTVDGRSCLRTLMTHSRLNRRERPR